MGFSSIAVSYYMVYFVSVPSAASNVTEKDCSKYCNVQCYITYGNQTESTLCYDAQQSCSCGLGPDLTIQKILTYFGMAVAGIITLLSLAAIYHYCKFSDECFTFRSSRVNKQPNVPTAVNVNDPL